MLRFHPPLVIFACLSLSCSLYTDTEEPDIFFTISDFDILELGRTISDMDISPDGTTVYLTDYNNNSFLSVNVVSKMSVTHDFLIGSHPVAMDLNSDGSAIIVALEGESMIALINTGSMEVIQSFPVSLMNMNDLAFINDSTIIISSKTDPSCITLSINDGFQSSQSVLNGEFAMDTENGILFVATTSSIKKYHWNGEQFYQDTQHISDPYGFAGQVHHFIHSSVSNTVFACISGPHEQEYVKHVYSYYGSDLTFAGKYLINSPGLGAAVSQDGSRVFIAPTDADEIGVFVVEFDQSTKLEEKYYLAGGNLTDRGILVDASGNFIYVLIDSPGDDDSFEPYNDYSFDLQRITISD